MVAATRVRRRRSGERRANAGRGTRVAPIQHVARSNGVSRNMHHEKRERIRRVAMVPPCASILFHCFLQHNRYLQCTEGKVSRDVRKVPLIKCARACPCGSGKGGAEALVSAGLQLDFEHLHRRQPQMARQVAHNGGYEDLGAERKVGRVVAQNLPPHFVADAGEKAVGDVAEDRRNDALERASTSERRDFCCSPGCSRYGVHTCLQGVQRMQKDHGDKPSDHAGDQCFALFDGLYHISNNVNRSSRCSQ